MTQPRMKTDCPPDDDACKAELEDMLKKMLIPPFDPQNDNLANFLAAASTTAAIMKNIIMVGNRVCVNEHSIITISQQSF